MQSTVCLEEQDIVAQLQRKNQELSDTIEELRDALKYRDMVSALSSKLFSEAEKIILPTLYDVGKGRVGRRKSATRKYIAERSGLSKETVDDASKALEKKGLIVKQGSVARNKKTGRFDPGICFKPTASLFTLEYNTPEKPRNQGGKRIPRCPSCGSDNVEKTKEVRLHTTITCKDCGAQEESSEPIKIRVNTLDERMKKTIEKARREKRQNDLDQNVPLKPDQECSDGHSPEVNLTNNINHTGGALGGATPDDEPSDTPCEGNDPYSDEETQEQDYSSYALLFQQSTLRGPIKGSADQFLSGTISLAEQIFCHGKKFAELKKSGEDKYTTIGRQPAWKEIEKHYLGKKTYAGRFAEGDDPTRAITFDTDNLNNWGKMCYSAPLLDKDGFHPVLSPSPNRGGHMMLVFDGPVDAFCALYRIKEIAPLLKDITEVCPSGNGKQMRFEGGRYVRNGIDEWCSLYDAYGKLISEGGPSALAAICERVTPASLIPSIEDILAEDESDRDPEDYQELGSGSRTCQKGTDHYYDEKYGSGGGFFIKFTPTQLALAVNALIPIKGKYYPANARGNQHAHWRGDSNPSVEIHPDNTWTDYGITHPNGKYDGGDVVELHCRFHDMTRKQAMRDFGKKLHHKAYADIIKAAQVGKPIPSWITQYATITPRGEHLYQDNLSQ